MHAYDDGGPRNPLQSQPSTCLFPAKSTGLASLCVQLTALVISVLITIFFFYQVGGLDEIGITQNTTSLLNDEEPSLQLSLASFNVDEAVEVLSNVFDVPTTTLSPEDVALEEGLVNVTEYKAIADRFKNMTINVDGIADAYELIRISTFVYIGLCVIWLFSLVLLLLSIKLETLELVLTNALVVIVCALYLIIHAIFILLLVYYKFGDTLTWRPMVVIIGTAAIQLICTAVCIFGMVLLLSWYKYIVYMHGGERCICVSRVARCFKRRRQSNAAQEYAMPEVTAPRQVPYEDRETRDFTALQ